MFGNRHDMSEFLKSFTTASYKTKTILICMNFYYYSLQYLLVF